MKLDQQSLKAICDCVAAGDSMDGAAKIVGCSRRLIYQLIEHSREARTNDENISGTVTHTLLLSSGNRPSYTEVIPSVYFFRWRDELSWFDLHILRARNPWQVDRSLDDCDDETLAALGYEDRYLRDQDGTVYQSARSQRRPWTILPT